MNEPRFGNDGVDVMRPMDPAARPVSSIENVSQVSGEPVLNGNGVTGPAASDAGVPRTTVANGEEAPATTDPVVSNSSNAAAAAPSEPQPTAVAPVPESETKKEPQAGDKRELDEAPDSDSKAASKDAPAAEHDKPEPEPKKQKTEISSAEPAPADENNTNEGPKKAGRPKKDKAKDVLKKVVPTDSIGSRTRSRTKAA